MLRRLLKIMAVLLLLVLAAAFFMPRLTDWNGQRDRIERGLTQSLGREVRIEGDVSLVLLPRPVLRARDVHVANVEGAAEPDFLAAEGLLLELRGLPLLLGRVEIGQVGLEHPVLALEELEDGRRSWDFGDGVSLPDFGVDSARVEDGLLDWRDAASGRTLRLEHVSLELEAGNGYEGEGRFSVSGRDFGYAVKTARAGENGAVPVNIRLSLPGETSGGASFSAVIQPGATGGWTGTGGVNLQLPDFAGALGEEDAAQALHAPFSLIADAEFGDRRLSLSRISARLGRGEEAASLEGEAGFDWGGEKPEISLSLSGDALDFDEFLPRLAPAEPPARSVRRPAPPPPFELPKGWEGSLSFALERIDFRGESFTDVRLEAKLADGALDIGRIAAGGGEATLDLSGRLEAVDRAPVLDLSGHIATGDAVALLAPFGLSVPGAAASGGKLPADLTGRFTGWRERGTVSGLSGRLGGSAVEASRIEFDLAAQRPRIHAALSLDRYDLGGPLDPALRWPALGSARVAVSEFLASRDIVLDIRIGEVSWAGLAITGFAVNGSSDATGLSLVTAGFDDLDGLSLHLSGRAAGLEPVAGLELSAEIRSEDAGPALEEFGVKFPGGAGALNGLAQISGNGAGGSIAFDLEVLGGHWQASGAYGRHGDGYEVSDLKLKLDYAEAHGLIDRFLPPVETPRPAMGALSLYGEITGGKSELTVTALQGTLGEVTLRDSRLGLALPGAQPRIDLALSTSALPLDRLWENLGVGFDKAWLDRISGGMTLSAVSIDWRGLHFDAPALDVRLSGGQLQLVQGDAGFLDGRIGATGRYGGASPFGFSVDATGLKPIRPWPPETLPRISDGVLGFHVEGTAQGWDSLSGKGSLVLDQARMDGFAPGAVAELAALGAESDPASLIGALPASIASGSVSGVGVTGGFVIEKGVAVPSDLFLSVPGFLPVSVEGSVDLAADVVALQAQMALDHGGALPPFVARLEGGRAAPRLALDLTGPAGTAAERHRVALLAAATAEARSQASVAVSAAALAIGEAAGTGATDARRRLVAAPVARALDAAAQELAPPLARLSQPWPAKDPEAMPIPPATPRRHGSITSDSVIEEILDLPR
jgi:hypothetical protein